MHSRLKEVDQTELKKSHLASVLLIRKENNVRSPGVIVEMAHDGLVSLFENEQVLFISQKQVRLQTKIHNQPIRTN